MAQAELAGGEHALSFTSMAERLEVSRTHVRNLFVEAEAAGHVRLGGGNGGPVAIMPPLWEAYDHFLADVQADQDAIAQTAFATLQAGARLPACVSANCSHH